jgi:hypothetical protein
MIEKRPAFMMSHIRPGELKPGDISPDHDP